MNKVPLLMTGLFALMMVVMTPSIYGDEIIYPYLNQNVLDITFDQSSFDVINIGWNFGNAVEVESCIMKTEIISFDLDAHGDEIAMTYHFVGLNQYSIGLGGILFNEYNIPTQEIPCEKGNITISMSDYPEINNNDYGLYTTFAVIINEKYMEQYAKSPYFQQGTNFLLVNEAQVGYSDSFVYPDKTCFSSLLDMLKFSYLFQDSERQQSGEVFYNKDNCNTL